MPDRRKRPPSLVPVLLALVSLVWLPHDALWAGSKYESTRVTVTSAAGRVSQGTLEMTPTIAQEGPVGSLSRCNDTFVQSAGFWSVLGGTPVPVFLTLAKDGFDPSAVDLQWTGSAPQFTLYRAPQSEAVTVAGTIVLNTSTCATSDTPPPSDVMFYVVVPTAP